VIRTLADRKDKNQGNFDNIETIREFKPFFIAVPCILSTMISMTNLMGEEVPEQLAELMYESGLISQKEAAAFSRVMDIRQLHGDGSCRRFFRIGLKGRDLCLAVAPAMAEGSDLAEARAAGMIGLHLRGRGVPVPSIYGWQQQSGLILFEDLGDTRLHDLARQGHAESLRPWYRQVLEQLVHMQLAGVGEFDTDWCWDTPRYDQELMIARESQYFLRSFWQEMLGYEAPDGIEDEFQEIASLAAGQGPDVFLHRDFQSRNIMIKNESVRFIDYQGGRLGPLGYDLASLLIDPYVALSLAFQEEMLQYYLDVLNLRQTVDSQAFRCQYVFLALQRNLQILGAFSFLSRVRKKEFFAQYIFPSLHMLRNRLAEPSFAAFPVLRRMIDTSIAVS
jgi:N-acetylmuramate 1-kinase